MRFELEVGDRTRTVQIERRGDAYEVTVDGRARLVDAVHLGAAAWSLLVRDLDGAARRSIEAAVIRRAAGTGFDVHINGFHIPVQVRAGLGRRTRDRGAHGGRGAGPQRVTAPMPGKVVRVLVQPGQAVKARQGLIVVEAMKMENELRASRDGQVREILVAEGQSVEAGAALMTVE